MKALQKNVTDTFKAIGEDPTESMMKFRQDFTAAMPTLTPEQVLQWLAAAGALAQLNQALGTTAQQAQAAADAAAQQAAAQAAALQKYNDYVAQFNPAALATTAFEGSLIGLHNTLTANI